MTDTTATYATWHTNTKDEVSMAHSHAPLWRHFIETLPERDLSSKTVLDFGCNRGGFLRLLHALKPFRQGVGIDIATDSIAAANADKAGLPLTFDVAHDLSRWPDLFDIAFSYEVIYLLPDIEDHARQVHRSLRDGGVYYAVTGCHTENPLWPSWRHLIGSNSNAPLQDRTPQDFIDAFTAAGFIVSVRRFGYDGFVSGTKDRRYYPSILDALAYPAEYKLLFRLEKYVR